MSQSAFRLDGKVALITGSARGIGSACARTFAEAGAKVMVSDILTDAGKAVAAAINDGGGTAAFTSLDVTSEAQWEAAVPATVERFAGLDVVVNNAGIQIMKPLVRTSYAEWRRQQAVNIDGVFFGIKHGILAMMPGGIAGRGGSIVNVSSVGGLVGFPGLASYSASKGAVTLLTKTAALECAHAGWNIRINSVHPGAVNTLLADQLHEEMVRQGTASSVEKATEITKRMHPMGRLGEPIDIALAIQFLASDASCWVTGSAYAVDGGFLAR
jgi:NAD(P)-dependent dehydrogenase (short-subunit alcohol dehydrogenase family)